MKNEYLKNAQSTCYPEKHMNKEFTNDEQIELCKRQEHWKIFGKWEQMLQNHRDSDMIMLKDCVNKVQDTTGLFDDGQACLDAYISKIRRTNSALDVAFRAEASHRAFV